LSGTNTHVAVVPGYVGADVYAQNVNGQHGAESWCVVLYPCAKKGLFLNF